MSSTFQPRLAPHRRTRAESVAPSPSPPPPPPPPALAQITDVSMDGFTGGLIVTFDRTVTCGLPGTSELVTPAGYYAGVINLSANVIRFDPQCGAGDSTGLPWSWSYGADALSPPADPAQTGTVD